MKRCSPIVVGQTATRHTTSASNQEGGDDSLVGTTASAALSRPANLKLSGAWAFYESRHQQDSERIRALEKQVMGLSSSNEALQGQLVETRAQLSAEATQCQALRSQAGCSEQQLRQLECRYHSLEECATRERKSLQKEVARLEEESADLKRELVIAADQAHSRNAEVATLTEDLRVSKESERQLADRVEAAEVAAAEHAERNAALTRENAALIQQRDHHVSHAELLMKEKNRYFTQLQELKKRQAEEAAHGDAAMARAAAHGGSARAPSAASTQQVKALRKERKEPTRSVSACVHKASESFTRRDAIREAQNRRRERAPAVSLP